MAEVYEIPVSNGPQTFLIVLAGRQYRLTLQYRDAAEAGWTLDISDANSRPMICGIPLVTGVDLLEPYPDSGMEGQLWVRADAEPDSVPAFSDLGRTSHLYFVSAS